MKNIAILHIPTSSFVYIDNISPLKIKTEKIALSSSRAEAGHILEKGLLKTGSFYRFMGYDEVNGSMYIKALGYIDDIKRKFIFYKRAEFCFVELSKEEIDILNNS